MTRAELADFFYQFADAYEGGGLKDHSVILDEALAAFDKHTREVREEGKNNVQHM